jgi:hypothetical protein
MDGLATPRSHNANSNNVKDGFESSLSNTVYNVLHKRTLHTSECPAKKHAQTQVFQSQISPQQHNTKL